MLQSGDIVIVKFPYVEGKGYKWRPALVVSNASFHKSHGMCWVAMITSAENPALLSDIPVASLKASGLNAPSVIRPAKLATLQVDKAEKIGNADMKSCEKALKFVKLQLG